MSSAENRRSRSSDVETEGSEGRRQHPALSPIDLIFQRFNDFSKPTKARKKSVISDQRPEVEGQMSEEGESAEALSRQSRYFCSIMLVARVTSRCSST